MRSNADERDRARFLDFLVNSVPRLEAPPYFAVRVANLARVDRYSFAGSLQSFSRRLVPVFMTLMILLCFAVYRWTTSDPLIESVMFYDEQDLSETITFEYVVGSLASLPDEEDENQQ